MVTHAQNVLSDGIVMVYMQDNALQVLITPGKVKQLASPVLRVHGNLGQDGEVA